MCKAKEHNSRLGLDLLISPARHHAIASRISVVLFSGSKELRYCWLCSTDAPVGITTVNIMETSFNPLDGFSRRH